MKKLLLLFLSSMLFGCTPPRTPKSVRYDGFYYCKKISKSDKRESYYHCLSFSLDSTAKSVSLVEDDIEELKRYVTTAPKDTGRFSIKLDSIKFKTYGFLGSVSYEGLIIDSNNLELRIKSLINGNISSANYLFVEYQ